ncbi:MAG: FkbM family methyltransferase [Crocinitomicaceae bacterium]
MKKQLKKLYRWLPTIGVLKTIRVIGTPPFYKYLTVRGNFNTKLPNDKLITLHSKHDLYIEKEIFWNGIFSEFEPYSLELWMKLAKNSDTVMDIGANTGIYATTAVASGAREVHAFEPVPYNFDILKKNKALNNMQNLHLNQLALSDQEGVVDMQIKANAVNYTNSLTAGDNKKHWSTIQVETTTLKDYISSRSINKLDLIKMDVEGHEPQILKDSIEVLKSLKPGLFIEVLNEAFANQLMEIFQQLPEYKFYKINEAKRSLKLTDNLITRERANYLITVKKL